MQSSDSHQYYQISLSFAQKPLLLRNVISTATTSSSWNHHHQHDNQESDATTPSSEMFLLNQQEVFFRPFQGYGADASLLQMPEEDDDANHSSSSSTPPPAASTWCQYFPSSNDNAAVVTASKESSSSQQQQQQQVYYFNRTIYIERNEELESELGRDLLGADDDLPPHGRGRQRQRRGMKNQHDARIASRNQLSLQQQEANDAISDGTNRRNNTEQRDVSMEGDSNNNNTLSQQDEDDSASYFDTYSEVITEDIPLGGTSKPMKKPAAVNNMTLKLLGDEDDTQQDDETDANDTAADFSDDDEDDGPSTPNNRDLLPQMTVQKIASNMWDIQKSYTFMNHIQQKVDTRTIRRRVDLASILSRREVWKHVYALYRRQQLREDESNLSTPSQQPSHHNKTSQTQKSFYLEFSLNNLGWTPQPKAELVFRIQVSIDSMQLIQDAPPDSLMENVVLNELSSVQLNTWKPGIDAAFFWSLLDPYHQLQQDLYLLEQRLTEREIKMSKLPAPPFIRLPEYTKQTMEPESFGVSPLSRSGQIPRSPQTVTNQAQPVMERELALQQLENIEAVCNKIDHYLTQFTRKIILNDRWMPHVGRLVRTHIVPHIIDFLSHGLRVKEIYEGNCFLWCEVIVGGASMTPMRSSRTDAQMEEYWNSVKTPQDEATPKHQTAVSVAQSFVGSSGSDANLASNEALEKLVAHVQKVELLSDDIHKMQRFLIFSLNFQMLHKWISSLYCRESVLNLYHHNAMVKHEFLFRKFINMLEQLSVIPFRIHHKENMNE